MNRGNQRNNSKVVLDLATLQNRCKRDPGGYRDEFIMQLRHFETLFKIFEMKPDEKTNVKTFQEQISFMSHVAEKYPVDLKEFPEKIAKLIEQHGHMLDRDLRRSVAQNLILLRNRNLLTAPRMFELAFKLFRVQDKLTRQTLYSHLVNNTKTINDKSRNYKLNSELQTITLRNLNGSDEQAAKYAIKLLVELYFRDVWKDAKVVNIIAQGIFSKITKIVSTCVRFFLTDRNSDDSSDDEEPAKWGETVREVRKEWARSWAHSTKSRAKKKKLHRMVARAKKNKKKDDQEVNFPALELINDPQSYTERVFKQVLKNSSEKFELRLTIMNFISRLIAVHQLLVFSWYPFMQNYLNAKQANITYILAILAQSCHPLIPAECLEPILKIIANNFVTDRSDDETIAVGLNAIREICHRCPLAMDADLLSDLVQYRKNRDKGVSIAGRGLFNYFKAANPMLLPKKERGVISKDQKLVKPLEYGEQKSASSVELLKMIEEEPSDSEEGEEDEWESVNSDDSDDDSSEGWESVNSDDEENDDDECSGDWQSVHSSDSEGNWDDWEDVTPASKSRGALKKLSSVLSRKAPAPNPAQSLKAKKSLLSAPTNKRGLAAPILPQQDNQEEGLTSMSAADFQKLLGATNNNTHNNTDIINRTETSKNINQFEKILKSGKNKLLLPKTQRPTQRAKFEKDAEDEPRQNDKELSLGFTIDRSRVDPAENARQGKLIMMEKGEKQSNQVHQEQPAPPHNTLELDDSSSSWIYDSESKVLSQRQLARLEKLGIHSKKTEDSDDDSDSEDHFFLQPSDLESKKRRKQTYEERQAHRREGQIDRPAYESRHKKKLKEKGPTTNELKQKLTKNFKMVSKKRAVRQKLTRSSKEKLRVRTRHSKKMKEQRIYKH